MSAQDNLSPTQFTSLYRGVTAGANWRNEIGHEQGLAPVTKLPNPLTEEGGVHFATGIGIHWSDRRSSAQAFADPTNNPENVSLDTKRPTAAIIHAKVAKSDILPQNLVDPDLHVLDYKEENENTVKPGSTVHVTKVEKIRQSGKRREVRYSPPRKKTA